MMAATRDELSPEEQERQQALDRSWEAAQEALRDPEFRSHLEQSIERVRSSTAAPVTRAAFLEETEPPAG